jgi:hypothetical protein
MRFRFLVVVGVAWLTSSCSDLTGQGPITFCMQWVNTSQYAVTFRAVDDVGDLLSTVTLNSPGIGDAFASDKIQLRGSAPITFSATENFAPVTFKPSGGNKVLIVEASRVSTTLEHYEDNGTCP